MIIKCDCGQLIGVSAGRRLIIDNRVVKWYFKKCKCGVIFVWIKGQFINIIIRTNSIYIGRIIR